MSAHTKMQTGRIACPTRLSYTVRPMKRHLLWFDVTIYLIVAALVFGLRPRTYQYWIGLALFLFGLAFWVTARLQLGRSFAITAQAKQLITHGLYSKISHPIYFFAGIALLGILVAAQSWIALVSGLALYSMQLGRVKRENEVLEQAFGEEYRQYRARTWF
jgi:protein-S-isoprenylcysteine O-methyltransferase Ste14